MADTTFIKQTIEPHLRRMLESWFPGQVFEERAVRLPGGSFKFDAVSGDGTIVAHFLSNRPRTVSGRENTGGVRKALDDVHCLKAVAATRRLLVFTDEGFRQLVMTRSLRFGTDGIEFLTCPLPAILQLQLDDNLDRSSREQRNRHDPAPNTKSSSDSARGAFSAPMSRRTVARQVRPKDQSAGTVMSGPENAFGRPAVDRPLATFAETLDLGSPYDQHDGYKGWKLPGRRENWLQWNDGDKKKPIRFATMDGEVRTWKVFARFGADPGAPWERPEPFQNDHKWILGGQDVWGSSYEVLEGYLGRLDELERRLKADLVVAFEYSTRRYPRKDR